MSYTARDVMSFLSISRETLRYYEQIGLVRPKIDEQNHYRRYDGWDVHAIAEALRLRSAEFSIEEIHEAREATSYEELSALYGRKAEASRKQAEILARLADKISEDAMALANVHLGKVVLRREEEVSLVPTYGDPPSFVRSEEAFTSYARMVRDDFALADFSIRFRMSDILKGEIHRLGCTCLRAPYIKYLQLSEGVVTLPQRLCLSCWMETKESEFFAVGDFEPIIAEADARGLELADTVLAIEFAHLMGDTHLFWVSCEVRE